MVGTHSAIMFKTIIFLLVILSQLINNEGILDDLIGAPEKPTEPEKCDSDVCKIDGSIFSSIKGPLIKLDPVKVGHIETIKISSNMEGNLQTMSVYPAVFKMDNFLSPEECEHIIKRAKEYGLHSSDLHMDAKSLENQVYRKSSTTRGSRMEYWDLDNNGKISVPDEIKAVAAKNHFLYLDNEEIENILKKFQVPIEKEGENHVITTEGFSTINAAGMAQYMHDIRETHPHHRDRTSDQVWINPHLTNDTLLFGIYDKLGKVTKLPTDIISASEPFQVVRYGERGHYYAHYDSQSRKEFPNLQCCQYTEDILSGQSCRLCRYLTALYFLNDPEIGGETAFPVAGDEQFEEKEFMKRKEGDMYNLSKFCQKANLVVKPKKGTLVMWYNHFTTNDGYLGELDKFSLHGGCDVIKGEKWIATTWIPVPEIDSPSSKSIFAP